LTAINPHVTGQVQINDLIDLQGMVPALQVWPDLAGEFLTHPTVGMIRSQKTRQIFTGRYLQMQHMKGSIIGMLLMT
jgi:hypothetical protein